MSTTSEWIRLSSTNDTNQRFEDLIAQAQTGRGTETISEAELLEFNAYLAKRGFGVSRMEAYRAKGGTVAGNQAPSQGLFVGLSQRFPRQFWRF